MAFTASSSKRPFDISTLVNPEPGVANAPATYQPAIALPKIEAAALDGQGRFQARVRATSPGSYAASLETVRELVAEAERQAGVSGASIGVGIPGSPACTCEIRPGMSDHWQVRGGSSQT